MLTISAILLAVSYVYGNDFAPTTRVGPCFLRPDGFARDPNDCRNYFICQNGRATRDRCTGDLLFDAENEICNWREQVKCFQCPQTASYSLQNVPKTCNQFYRCWHGRVSIHTCPNNLVFDPNRGACNFLRGSGCDGDDTIQDRCPAVDGEFPVYLPDATSCSRYHICHNGRPWQQECADGLHFNPHLGSCDTPERSGCQLEQVSFWEWEIILRKR